MRVMYVTFILGLLIPGYLCNDVANLVYIDASNGEIVRDGNVVATQPTGVHGDIVHNAAVYFSVLDNFVQVTVPPTISIPVLNEVPGDVQDIAECCFRVFAVLSHGNGEYSVAVYYDSYTKIFFTFTGRLCAPKIAISCTNRMLYYTTDTGIFQWDFTDSDLNAPTELGSIGSDDFIANPTYGNCPFCLQYEEDGSSLPVLYFTLESSNRIYQLDSAGSFSIFQTISDRTEIRHLTADATCLYYTSVTGTTHRVEYRPRASPATAATLVTDTVQASGLWICETPNCVPTCPPLECSTCLAGCGACLPAGPSTSGPCFCSNIFQENCTFASTSTLRAGCDVVPMPTSVPATSDKHSLIGLSSTMNTEELHTVEQRREEDENNNGWTSLWKITVAVVVTLLIVLGSVSLLWYRSRRQKGGVARPDKPEDNGTGVRGNQLVNHHGDVNDEMVYNGDPKYYSIEDGEVTIPTYALPDQEMFNNRDSYEPVGKKAAIKSKET